MNEKGAEHRNICRTGKSKGIEGAEHRNICKPELVGERNINTRFKIFFEKEKNLFRINRF